MSSIWWKIIAIAGFVLLLLSLFFIIKLQYDNQQKQEKLNSDIIELKQLQDNAVRSSSKYVTNDDLNKISNDLNLNLKNIQKDLDNYHANISSVDSVKIITQGMKSKNISSSNIIKNANPSPDIPLSDSYGYFKNQQILNLNEPFGNTSVPFGNVGFSAWQKEPWELNIFPRKYSLNTVIGQDPNGKTITYHNMFVETEGKKYPIKIDESQTIQELPKSQFFFNPRIYLAANGGVLINSAPKAELTPSVEVSFVSYGPVKTNPEWIFGNVGIGYGTIGKNLNFVVSPVGYNIGYKLPLIDNLVIGPAASVDISGNFAAYIGIRAGL